MKKLTDSGTTSQRNIVTASIVTPEYTENPRGGGSTGSHLPPPWCRRRSRAPRRSCPCGLRAGRSCPSRPSVRRPAAWRAAGRAGRRRSTTRAAPCRRPTAITFSDETRRPAGRSAGGRTVNRKTAAVRRTGFIGPTDVSFTQMSLVVCSLQFMRNP